MTKRLVAPEEVWPKTPRVERYSVDGRRLQRTVSRRDGTTLTLDAGVAPRGVAAEHRALHAFADREYLRATERPNSSTDDDALTVVDLFSGIGSLSLGVIEAARSLDLTARVALAVDIDEGALGVLGTSLGLDEDATQCVDLGTTLRGTTTRATKLEQAFLERCPSDVDVLVAGPPCQGHSRLNNHTRHDDPRNDLYGCVARFVELKRPRLCIIENVDSIVHDQRRSSQSVVTRLRKLDYRVDEGRVLLHSLGVPQARRRHVLVATRSDSPDVDVERTLEANAVDVPELRTVRWAIEDLQSGLGATSFDTASRPNAENLDRMRWLIKHDEYDLPNDRRPVCHRLPKMTDTGQLREHSYRSMYGRLDWDKPAQTITSGYGSMGQGRYVHPAQPRTLTPHEAARLQFIPDFMRFDGVTGRGRWAKMIGNVAPMKLSYVFALEFLR